MIDSKAVSLLNDLLESMNDSIIVDSNNKIIFFSENYASDSNVSSSAVIGVDVREVIENTRMHKIIETGKEEVAELFSANISKQYQATPNKKEKVVHICNRIPIRKNGDPNGEILGAFAYTSLANTHEFDKMRAQLSAMEEKNKLISQHLVENYKAEYQINSIIGSSKSITKTKEQIVKYAPSGVTVSITGETGTGKELIAGALHSLSNRSNKPFIKINCASIPENLLESELFGYEPGSFTGALKNGKIGKFELANGGTILLDEIGEMPLALQAKLLRVLQEKEVERIGGKNTIPLDVRVLCSTNRNLEELVRSGGLREDLYYRINVMEIKAPALRDRLDDIKELCDFFVAKENKKGYVNITYTETDVYDFLSLYNWPGNVREFEHAIECACLLSEDGILKISSFPFLKNKMDKSLSIEKQLVKSTSNESSDRSEFAPAGRINLSSAKEETEYNIIFEAMQQCHFNVTLVAKNLNTNRSTLYRKLKKYKIFPYNE